jgi:hypothetical protein
MAQSQKFAQKKDRRSFFERMRSLPGIETLCRKRQREEKMDREPNQSKPWRGLLAFVIGVVTLGLVAVGIFFAITEMVRQTTQKALEPVTNASGRVETRMAEFFNRTPTVVPDPITIVHDVRSLARLETIQYSMEKVVTAEAGQGELSFLFGDRLLFVAHGTVIAGMDLSQLRPQDLWVEGEVLYVRLPPAQVFVATLNNEKSYVYDRDTGLLNKGDQNLETSARQAAEKAILEAALDDGILMQAHENAENYLDRLFRSMGYRDVIFVSPTPTPPPP